MSKRTVIAAALGAAVAAGIPAPARAVVPDVTGTYVGQVTETDSSCSNPADDGVSALRLTLNITNQVGSSIDGDGTTSDGDQFSFSSGSVTPSGSITIIQFSFSGSNPANGETFGGFASLDLAGSTLSITSVSGSRSIPPSDSCSFSITGTLTRAASGAVSATSPSSAATGTAELNLQVLAVTGSIGARVADALRGTLPGARRLNAGFLLESPTGRAAGEGFESLAVWGSLSRSDFEDSFAATAYDGDRLNLLAGVDLSPWENVVVGVALGYESSDVTTTFNSGEQDTDGWTIAPYGGAVLGERWSIDGSIGYSNVSTDQFRTTAGTRVTSEVDGERFFASFNLSGVYAWEDWVVTPSLGWTLARGFDDGFTESDGTVHSNRVTRLEQWRIGAEAAYAYGDFEPYARATYERDYAFTKVRTAAGAQPANDNDDILFAAGLRYFGSQGLSGSFEWNRRLGRSDFDEDLFSLTVRYEF